MIKNIWGKVAYIWFITMLFIVGFLCGGLEVDALTNAPYSTRKVGVSWVDEAISNQFYNEADFNTTLRPPTGYAPPLNHMRNIVFTVNTSSTWKAGNIYTFTATFWTSSRDLEEFKSAYTFDPWTSTNQNGSSGIQGSNNANVSQFNCLINLDAEETNYIMSCSFIPKRDIKSFTIFWRGVSQYRTYPYSTSILWWGMDFTYTEDTAGAINNQTNVIQNNFNTTNNNIKNIDDTLKDDDIDSPNSMISDFEDMLPSNGVITNLIGLPIILYTKVLNSINGTCSQFDLGSLYGTNLIIPCIDVSTYLGTSLWGIIDLMISGFFILAIAKKMIKAFEGFTSMKEGDVLDD